MAVGCHNLVGRLPQANGYGELKAALAIRPCRPLESPIATADEADHCRRVGLVFNRDLWMHSGPMDIHVEIPDLRREGGKSRNTDNPCQQLTPLKPLGSQVEDTAG